MEKELIYYIIKNIKLPITYNYLIYWTVVIIGILSCLLPKINITVSSLLLIVLDIIFLPIAILSYNSLRKINDYKLIYKRINTKKAALNSNQAKEYSRQAMIEIKDKDKKIDEKKLKIKKDITRDLVFSSKDIKKILLRSAKWFATISLFIIIVIAILVVTSTTLQKKCNSFL